MKINHQASRMRRFDVKLADELKWFVPPIRVYSDILETVEWRCLECKEELEVGNVRFIRRQKYEPYIFKTEAGQYERDFECVCSVCPYGDSLE